MIIRRLRSICGICGFKKHWPLIIDMVDDNQQWFNDN